jgi:hypothetical protein
VDLALARKNGRRTCCVCGRRASLRLGLADLDRAAGQFQAGLLERLVVEAVPAVAGAVVACLDITANGGSGHLLPAEVVLTGQDLELLARGARPLAGDPGEGVRGVSRASVYMAGVNTSRTADPEVPPKFP